jgi:hypothetical protein
MNASTSENISHNGPQRPVGLSGVAPQTPAARRAAHRLLLLAGVGREKGSRFNSSL